MQEQEARNRTAGSHTDANLAQPDERELPAMAAFNEGPLETLRAALEDMEPLQAATGGLETIESHSKPAPYDAVSEQTDNAQAAEADPIAAPSIDEPNMVS